jgi:hypothetical protein
MLTYGRHSVWHKWRVIVKYSINEENMDDLIVGIMDGFGWLALRKFSRYFKKKQLRLFELKYMKIQTLELLWVFNLKPLSYEGFWYYTKT